MKYIYVTEDIYIPYVRYKDGNTHTERKRNKEENILQHNTSLFLQSSLLDVTAQRPPRQEMKARDNEQ